MRTPFVVNVGEELRHPGTRRTVAFVGHVRDVMLSSARIADDADVEVDAVVEAQGATVIVQGTARAPWVGECRRCLRPTGGEITVELHEVFEPSPVEGETFLLEGEQIDLTPMLRESLALGLPLAPLCSDDCAGPDPEGHPVGSEDDDEQPNDQGANGNGSTGPSTDPRWAVLDDLRFDA